MATAELPTLLTTRELAACLRKSPRTVRRLVAEGQIPAVRITKMGPFRFDLGEIKRMIEGRTS